HPAASQVHTCSWIEVQAVGHPGMVAALRSRWRLGLGECAAMALAMELSSDWLVLDDEAARRVAHGYGLPVTGTVGVILAARERGVIPAVRPVLDALRKGGARISDRLYAEALKRAGE